MEQNKKWYLTKDGKNIALIAVLLMIPLATSIYSTIHAFDFLGLGNSRVFAIPLAAIFEAGLLAALAALQIMRNVEKWSMYTIFIILTLLQFIGNLYYGYNYMTEHIKTNPYFIQNFIELFEFIHDPEDAKGWKRIISFAIGGFLPVISMIFLHMNMVYIMSKPETTDTLEDKKLETQPEAKKNVEAKKEPEFEEINPAVIDAVAKDMVYAALNETELSEVEIEEVKQRQEENKEQIQEIKEELGKNVEENLYIRLLTALYKNGEVKAGDLIQKWENLLQDIKRNEISVTDKEIKQFLVLCTVLKIIDMNDQNYRVFKKSFEQAKQILNLLA